MTTPNERTRAVQMMEEAVKSLAVYSMAGVSNTVMVPRQKLRNLQMILRHYPISVDLSLSHLKAPELWGKPE